MLSDTLRIVRYREGAKSPPTSRTPTIVPKSIPLAAALSVEVEVVVIDATGCFIDELPLKRVSIETRVRGFIQRPVQRHTLAGTDLRRSLDHNLWGQKVQGSEII